MFPQKKTPLVLLFAFAALILVSQAAVSPALSANPPEADSLAQQVIELTNAERAKVGVPPLKLQSNLRDAAMWYAQDMADYNYYNADHTDRLGRDPGQRETAFGYIWNAYGENQAAGQGTPAAAMTAWMNSAPHKANILSTMFSEIGVGYGYKDGSTYTRYWVQDFGQRPNVYPVIINGEAAQTTSSNVSLYIYGSGWAQQMRLSNDGVNWTAWETYASTRSWTLAAGTGTRTVSVQLRKDTTTVDSNDSIVVTTTPPTPTNTVVPPTVTPTPTHTPIGPTPTSTVVGPTPTSTHPPVLSRHMFIPQAQKPLVNIPLPGIVGRVTHAGAGAAGFTLDLRLCTSSCSTAYQTSTDANGYYRFAGVSSLPSGAYYYVRWQNSAQNLHYVEFWHGPNIIAYVSGQTAAGGDFDIESIDLQTPPNDSTVTLPATFGWASRGIAGDSYRFVLWDLADTIWLSQPLGGNTSATVTGLPSAIVPGQTYGWYVRVDNGGGYGESLTYRRIQFTNTSALIGPALTVDDAAWTALVLPQRVVRIEDGK